MILFVETVLLSFARCVFFERAASSNLPLEMRVRSVVQVWGCRCIVEELVYLSLNRLAVSYEEHIPLPEGLLHVRVILWIDMGLSCSWAGLPRATGYSPSCTPFVRPEMWLLILQVLQKQSCFGPFGCALAISFYLDQSLFALPQRVRWLEPCIWDWWKSWKSSS